MPHAWVAAPLLVIAVLTFSGIAKMGKSDHTLSAMASLGLPTWLRRGWIASGLPWVEVLLAVGLLLAPGAWAVVISLGALGLLCAYWVIIAVALRGPEQADCGCFGEVGDARVTRWTLVRNTVLLGLGIVTVFGAVDGRSVVAVLFGLGAEAWWLVALGCAFALAWLIRGGAEAPTARNDAPDEMADYLRTPIPFASLVTQEGGVVTLRELASTKARLLLFLSSTCSPCTEVAARVPAWTRAMPEIGIHAVFAAYSSHLEDTMRDVLADAYYEDSTMASRVLELPGSPCAVLLGADGLIAGGPVAGSGAIIEFVEQIKDQLVQARA